MTDPTNRADTGADTSVVADAAADERRRAVERGLLPIVRVAGRDVHWTMQERQAHYACPAVSVAVMKDGHIDWAGAWGRRHVDQPTPADVDTVFMVASCSKPVTGVLVLQQVDRGVLDLDTDVNSYLRRWKLPRNEFTDAHPVTLRRILSHTAGLNINGWGVTPNDGRPVPTVDDLLEGRTPSKYGPVAVDKAHDGTDRYSGAGFLIAQLVLEDVLGTTFDRLADEMIFTPLGMTRSSFLHPMPERFLTNYAAGHGDDGAAHPGGGWMISSEMAAGGLFSTAADYARFMLGVRAAWLGEGGLLSRGIAREMMTRVERSSFGLGARVLGTGPSLRCNHGGSNDGFQSESNAYLETGNGAVVLTNSTSGLFLWKEVMNGIAEVYEWPGFLPPPKHRKEMTPDEMQRYVGTFRIEVGIELPRLNIWIENGALLSEVPGLRFGVQEAFLDENGTMYSNSGAFDVHVEFGADGRAERLHVMEGDLLVISARREDDAPG